jgi:hypothetical protein
MITVNILEKTDVLLETDWIRPIMGQCGDDEVNTTNMYSGQPMNHLKWIQAKHVFGKGWFDPPKTIGKMDKKLKAIGGFEYEVIRGDMPKKHRHDWKGRS